MTLEYLSPLATIILETVPQPVWVVDGSGNILFCNDAAVEVLGYADATELEGQPSHATVHHSHHDGTPFPAAECHMLRPARTGEPEHGDTYWFARKDGTLFPVAWWSAPVDLPTGRGTVTSFTDLTERFAFERSEVEREAALVREAEAQASQRRILEATAQLRQDTARNLHDGAQQRLVSTTILLRLAAERVDGDGDAAAMLQQAADELQEAIDELRVLAAGMYPTTLTSHGLGAAIEGLVQRVPVPVRLCVDVSERLPEWVAAHVYFVIAEALANAGKHAHASAIDVTVQMVDGMVVEVRDDGCGGAAPSHGTSGLVAMQDRVRALGGELAVSSPVGEGTLIRFTVPASVGSLGESL
jgi:PAS domain S-box-containing protein